MSVEPELYEVETSWCERPDEVVLHFLGAWRVDELFHDLIFHPGATTPLAQQSRALDSMLSDLSDFLDQEVEVRLQRILSLVEPIMLVLMGLIAATLLLSVYLPLFSLLGQVQG